ncbi:hypothetical protein FQA39_LY13689 [Lamprigera yunnana]|nr:hypothetical protein FQA39_LY13689 [Lamprigera yunnana]
MLFHVSTICLRMKTTIHVIVIGVICWKSVVAVTAATVPTTAPTDAQPVYHHQDPIQSYIPHETYPYSDGYGPNTAYEGYLIPANVVPYLSGEIKNPVISQTQSALYVMLRVLAKVGLFLLGGVALLVVGGVFTTAVCSLTPFCAITFNGFKDINKETVRSLVTPERVASAAAFVENAVNKYQRLQRAIDENY